jgi:hypothetical protein
VYSVSFAIFSTVYFSRYGPFSEPPHDATSK